MCLPFFKEVLFLYHCMPPTVLNENCNKFLKPGLSAANNTSQQVYFHLHHSDYQVGTKSILTDYPTRVLEERSGYWQTGSHSGEEFVGASDGNGRNSETKIVFGWVQRLCRELMLRATNVVKNWNPIPKHRFFWQKTRSKLRSWP